MVKSISHSALDYARRLILSKTPHCSGIKHSGELIAGSDLLGQDKSSCHGARPWKEARRWILSRDLTVME